MSNHRDPQRTSSLQELGTGKTHPRATPQLLKGLLNNGEREMVSINPTLASTPGSWSIREGGDLL